MKDQVSGITVSALLHCTILLLICSVGQILPTASKTMVIDFNIDSYRKEQPATSDNPQQTSHRVEKPDMKKAPAPTAARQPEKPPPPATMQKIVQNTPPPPAAVLAAEEPPAPATQQTAAQLTESTEAARPFEQTTSGSSESMALLADPARAAGNASGETEPQISGGLAEEVSKKYLAAHFQYIRDDIQKKVAYPAIARKMGWEGKVVISFTVCEDGQVSNIKIVKSSGYSVLDGHAVQCVQKAAPFPKPPVRAELIVPIRFGLV